MAEQDPSLIAEVDDAGLTKHRLACALLPLLEEFADHVDDEIQSDEDEQRLDALQEKLHALIAAEFTGDPVEARIVLVSMCSYLANMLSAMLGQTPVAEPESEPEPS